jgi:DNA helicase-2/ATP-dependent DNA helicase PcrA
VKEYILKPVAPNLRGKPLHIAYEKELNPQQLEAVTAGEGPMLVIAGAGSGKTRTLTYRVAWLVEHGVPPERILLLTFTNKAAREMLSRVESLLPADISKIWGGTFHAIGNRVLRRHAKLLGYSNDFTILDRDDSKELINACLADAKIDTREQRFPKGDVLGEIFSLLVNTEKPLARLLAEQFPYFEHLESQILDVRKHYESRKKKNNAMDFDDLLLNWLKLLQEHDEVRAQYQERFLHVLVDEYQDTNKIQADLVDILAAKNRNVMVVGDDSQSIYSWRGANFQNILTFPDRFSGARIYKIETNYRSTPEILEVANAAIAANAHQFRKTLHASRESGMKPMLAAVTEANMQAQFVAQRILELRDEGISLNEMAVLYRAHYHSMELQMELTRRNIPFLVTSGVRFFEQAHIKDAASFLKVAVNPTDELAFKRILKLLPGVGPKTADKIFNVVSKIMHAGKKVPKSLPEVPKKAEKTWPKLAEILDELRETPPFGVPSAMIEAVIESVYDDFLKASYTDYESRREDLEQLARFSRQFETVESLLTQLALLTNLEAEDVTVAASSEQEMVRLTTVHQAKGLEWKAVFVIWLADGMFPSAKSLGSIEGEEEERRLFYVAITRAKDELYLSYPLMRQGGEFGETWQKPSRFLQEIPKKLLEEIRVRPQYGWGA